jgi:catechol 2,3-dioxygenase-like lactoylglutathione lyase family enzyme
MIHSRASAGGAPAPRRPAAHTARVPAVVQQVTFLDTWDPARTADFDERILGLRLARDQGRCRIYHASGGAYLGFCQRADAPTEPRGVVATLVPDGVDALCAHLRSYGVEFVKEPADNPPYRIYNAFVRDPNGYTIEIQRFWEPLV